MNPKILIAQWGRAGAGQKLAFDLAIELEKIGAEVYVSICDVGEYHKSFLEKFGSKTLVFKIGRKFNIASPIRLVRAKFSLNKFVDEYKLDLTVFVMPHPWDILLSPRTRIVRIIHDAYKHPGDGIWPRNSSLKRRILSSDQIVVLSASVGESVSQMGAKPILGFHPTFVFTSADQNEPRNIDVLVIGRQRRYKGTGQLIEIWPLVLNRFPDARLVVAGAGRIDRKVWDLKNIEILNEWLTEEQIGNLLSRAKCVLFPYIEASQSGLLPSAVLNGAVVVATPIGGLIEQASALGGIISESHDPAAIAKSVTEALEIGVNRNSSTFLAPGQPKLSDIVLALAQENL